MPPESIEQFGVHEFVIESSESVTNPFSSGVGVIVTHAEGTSLRIPGFYDGDRVWRVRFSPSLLGKWKVKGFSDGEDIALSVSEVECIPNRDLSAHGRLRVDSDHSHRFSYADGSSAFPLGFEWNWLSAYHQEHTDPRPDQPNPTFGEALDMIREGGFNYIVANLYADYYHKTPITDETKPYLYQHPRLYPFGGTNDDPDHSVLNLAFFQDFDHAVEELAKRSTTLHLMIQVQNKKVNWPDPGSSEDDQFWRYLVARYQAYPNIVWDLSKESYNLLKRTGSHAYALSRVQLIREEDAHQNLVTAHDTERESWGRSTELDDACDFITDQVKFSGTVEGWQSASTLKLNREAIRRWRNVEKPYLNVEYGYEEGEPPHVAPIPKMTVSGETMLDWTWALVVGGAYANYYYCNTSWDLCRFDLTPKSWASFGHLRAFMDDVDLQAMVPDNDYVSRGLCSSDDGKSFLVYLPDGGNTRVDLSLSGGIALKATWMNTRSGERLDVILEEKGFSAKLVNPLADLEIPSVVHVRPV